MSADVNRKRVELQEPNELNERSEANQKYVTALVVRKQLNDDLKLKFSANVDRKETELC